jgi:hypothetical protein
MHSRVALVVLAIILFSACDTVIHPDLESAPPVLVVEAWLNDKSEKQIIQLTQTQPYFDTSKPIGISGATVTVTDDLNTVYTFVDDGSNSGTYQWTPALGQNIGTPGRTYTLVVQTSGEIFQAITPMKRTTAIDSITFEIKPEFQFPKDSYIAQFWAQDPSGKGDSYWIRAFKNGVLLNKPMEINVAYDGGFSAGGDIDGVQFIQPIREAINPLDEDPKDKNQNLPPYAVGDSVYVEIHSITLAAFDHLHQVIDQTNRQGGFGALFARPLENVSTNIINNNPNGSKVTGFFSVSAVKGLGKKFVK